jgi:hypothetical protein
MAEEEEHIQTKAIDDLFSKITSGNFSNLEKEKNIQV